MPNGSARRWRSSPISTLRSSSARPRCGPWPTCAAEPGRRARRSARSARRRRPRCGEQLHRADRRDGNCTDGRGLRLGGVLARMDAARRPARRVLILRAQHGREWLGEQFAAAGAAGRAAGRCTPASTARSATTAAGGCNGWIDGRRRVVTVFSSSEAVDALDRQLAVAPRSAATGCAAGVAVATHGRIANSLLGAGYTHVELSAPDDDALMARLESHLALVLRGAYTAAAARRRRTIEPRHRRSLP